MAIPIGMDIPGGDLIPSGGERACILVLVGALVSGDFPLITIPAGIGGATDIMAATPI